MGASHDGTVFDPLRIALVFGEYFPATKGGAERWFGALSRELARQGHNVTYVTRALPAEVDRPNFRLVELGSARPLYDSRGTRSVGASVLWGAEVMRFLRRHRDEFDLVYVHQTPIFPVIGARLALGRRRPWATEWIEWWPLDYWRRYAPGVVGVIGWATQRLALQCTTTATVFARSTRDSLLRARKAVRVVLMPGQIVENEVPSPERTLPDQPPLLLFVGRLVHEKHPLAFIEAVAAVASRRPVRGLLIGQGPLLEELRSAAKQHPDVNIQVAGPVDDDVLEAAYRNAAVLVHPSEREGFGLVVVEACARGVPVVVVAGPDNAAVELVIDGVNGLVAPDRSPARLANAIESVMDGSPTYRRTARRWYEEQRATRSVRQTAVRLAGLASRGSQQRPGRGLP